MQVPGDFMVSDSGGMATRRFQEMFIEEEKRKKRVEQITALVIGVIMTVVGIYFIGQSVVDLGTGIAEDHIISLYWDPFQLECGIFVTLVGTVLMAVSINSLVSPMLSMTSIGKKE